LGQKARKPEQVEDERVKARRKKIQVKPGITYIAEAGT
jgi:hypothetical protein